MRRVLVALALSLGAGLAVAQVCLPALNTRDGGGAKVLAGGAALTSSASSTLTAGSGGALVAYALPADRLTTWRPGLTYNGGIPQGRTQCQAYKGTNVDGSFKPADGIAAVQNALNNCPDNTYVLLGAGTFAVTDDLRITRNNITLRGQGAGVTFVRYLTWTGSGDRPGGTPVASPITIGNWDGVQEGWGYWKAATSDGVKGTNYILLANVSGLSVGEMVHINEQFDSTISYYNGNPNAGQTTDYLGWGECRCVRSDCVTAGCTATSNTTTARNESRPVGQAMLIASIGGATCTGVANAGCLTFTTNFHWTFRVSKNAHLARLTLNDHTTLAAQPQYVGIENLTSEFAYGGDGWANFNLIGSHHCWLKNVEAFGQVQGAGVAIRGGFQNEVRDSFIHSAQDPNPGGSGYLIEAESYASDNLIENNIMWSGNKVIAMRSSGGGNVIGYNYFEDGYGGGYPYIVEVGMNASHMTGSHMELFEGNQAFNFDSDSLWGNQHNIVVFRNHLTTLRRNVQSGLNYGPCTNGIVCTEAGVPVSGLIDSDARRGIGLTVFQRNYSFVGNVIGYPNGYLQSPAIGHAYPYTFSPAPHGTTFVYEWLTGSQWGGCNDASGCPPGGVGNMYLWQIGYDGSGVQGSCGNGCTTQDSISMSSTLRDGNYDYFTHAVHWHGIGGTGTGQTACCGASTTGSGNLPLSLYIPDAMQPPAFFNGGTWPWVDGSSSTTPLPGALPARTRFDAGTPNTIP